MSENRTERLQEALQLLESGMKSEAIEILKELVKDMPDKIEAWYNLGYALTGVEDFEACETDDSRIPPASANRSGPGHPGYRFPVIR